MRIAPLFLMLFATPAAAHDFWIQPQNFGATVGKSVGITFQIGHGVDRQRWGNGLERIIVLQSFFPGQQTDLRGSVRETAQQDFAAVPGQAGVHVVAMQSTPAFSELPALRFNDYAKAEGLTPIIAARQREGTTGSAGRELYTRRAKTLIQAGPAGTGDQRMATRPIGLKLEIVPERSPYALGTSRRLPVRVIYRGRSLANATVKFTDLDQDSKPLATAVTDRNGRAAFMIPTSGKYLLNVVWSERLVGDSRADFDTTFSSLTFGFDR